MHVLYLGFLFYTFLESKDASRAFLSEAYVQALINNAVVNYSVEYVTVLFSYSTFFFIWKIAIYFVH